MTAKLLCPQNILAAKISCPQGYYSRKNIFCRGKHGGPDRPMFWQSILTLLVARLTGLLIIVASKKWFYDSYVWLRPRRPKLSESPSKILRQKIFVFSSELHPNPPLCQFATTRNSSTVENYLNILKYSAPLSKSALKWKKWPKVAIN